LGTGDASKHLVAPGTVCELTVISRLVQTRPDIEPTRRLLWCGMLKERLTPDSCAEISA